jgi:hypothetical protein
VRACGCLYTPATARRACVLCARECRACGWQHSLINDPTYAARLVLRAVEARFGAAVDAEVHIVELLPAQAREE